MHTGNVGDRQLRTEYVRLTARQREVLALIARGHTNGEIAERLGISLDGAKYHVSEILGELGVATREEAGDWWRDSQRPGARMSRALRALTATATARVIGVGAALVITGLAAIATIVLLSRDDESPAAAPDPAASATTAPSLAPNATVTATPPGVSPSVRIEPGVSKPEAFTTAPLLVYADVVGSEDGSERAFPVVEVVSYDLEREEVVASFRIGSRGHSMWKGALELAGRTVVSGVETGVVASNLDGSDARVIYTPPDGATVVSLKVSRDGSYIAVSTEAADLVDLSLATLAILEVATGRIILEVGPDVLVGTPGFGAPAAVLGWDDSRTVIELRTIRHKGGPGSTGSLYLDGHLEPHDGRLGPLTADGSRGAWTVGDESYVCEGMGQLSTAMAVRDVSTGTEEARIELPGHVISGEGWSPDGSELMLSAYPLTGTHQSGEPCWDYTEGSWHLWDGTTLEAVADVEAVLRRWYGDQFIERTCEGAPVPIEAPWQVSDFRCTVMADSPPVTLSIGGQAIGEVRDARVLGFVDAAP